MSEGLNKLYDAVIREHHAHPYHFERRKDFHTSIKSNNPVCGDRYEFFMSIDGNKILSVYFHGFGCAVSMASGSVISKLLEGKTVQQALEICQQFLDSLEGTAQPTFSEFNSFIVVRDFPSRYDCAALAWKEMREYLKREVK